jgi:hypothetical protein
VLAVIIIIRAEIHKKLAALRVRGSFLSKLHDGADCALGMVLALAYNGQTLGVE